MMLVALAAGALAGCNPTSVDRARIEQGLDNIELGDLTVTRDQAQGNWRIVAIDGRLMRGGSGIAITIVDDAILFRGGGGSRPYRFGTNGLAFRTCDDPNYTPPETIIAAGYPPHFSKVRHIVAGSSRIERSFDVGITISGHGQSVTLFRE